MKASWYEMDMRLQSRNKPVPNALKGHTQLSTREQEVFDLLTLGFYYREISARLEISYATVHTHLKHIYKKLRVRSRNQAVAKFLLNRATEPVGQS